MRGFYIMREIHDTDDILMLAKALDSSLRMRIIGILIEKKQMNLSDLSEALEVTNGALTSHIKILKDANIIDIINTSSGKRGSQKICVINENKFLIDMTLRSSSANAYEVELPVGTYSNFSAMPTCGLATANSIVGEFDNPRYFDDPARYNASIIWLSRGFLEYRIPNYLEFGQKPTKIQISLELSSEAPGYCEEWPSDISFFINNHNLGFWTSPGDFGESRGLFTPNWWPSVCNQYGILKLLTVNKEGSFVDGLKVSDVTIDDVEVINKSSIVFRIAVSEDKQHIGGLTIFGKSFGNYPQGIRVRVEYEIQQKNQGSAV
jgi:predicted transcriptional regulator